MSSDTDFYLPVGSANKCVPEVLDLTMSLQVNSVESDANHDAQFVAVTAVFATLSFSALLFRLYSRKITAGQYFTDDYLTAFAWVNVYHFSLK